MTMPTQEQKLIAYIAQRLQMEPDTVEYLLDLAERDAVTSWEQEKAHSLESWKQLRRESRLWGLTKEAIRYENRHRTQVPDDKPLDEIAVPPTQDIAAQIQEGLRALTADEHGVMRLCLKGWPISVIANRRAESVRTVERLLASAKAKLRKHL